MYYEARSCQATRPRCLPRLASNLDGERHDFTYNVSHQFAPIDGQEDKMLGHV